MLNPPTLVGGVSFPPGTSTDFASPGRRGVSTIPGGDTKFRSHSFRQEYAQELSDETYGTYNFNWGYYLNSLKLLCETGTGTPFVPPV